jgi:hypothetical protein
MGIVVGSMRYSSFIEALTRLCEEEEDEYGYVSVSSGYDTPSAWSASEDESDDDLSWAGQVELPLLDEEQVLCRLPHFTHEEIVNTAIENACMDENGYGNITLGEFRELRDRFATDTWPTLSEDVKQEFMDSALFQLEDCRNDRIDFLAAEYASEAEAEKDLIDADQMLEYRAHFEMYVWNDWSEEERLPYIKRARCTIARKRAMQCLASSGGNDRSFWWN